RRRGSRSSRDLPRARGPRDALNIATHLDELERSALVEVPLDLRVLSKAELEHEMTAVADPRRRFGNQSHDRIETICSAVERDLGLLAHLGLKSGSIARADVRRIRADEIEALRHALEQIRPHETDARRDTEAFGVPPRDRERRL